MKKPFVIAEVGCNHKGDLELAKELFDEGITLDEYYARKVSGSLKR